MTISSAPSSALAAATASRREQAPASVARSPAGCCDRWPGSLRGRRPASPVAVDDEDGRAGRRGAASTQQDRREPQRSPQRARMALESALRIPEARRALLERGLHRLDLVRRADQRALELRLEREARRRIRVPGLLEQPLARADRVGRAAGDLARQLERRRQRVVRQPRDDAERERLACRRRRARSRSAPSTTSRRSTSRTVCVSATSGTRPHWISRIEKRASGRAMRRSAPSAIWKPPP